MNPRHRPRGRARLRASARVPGCLALICGLLLYGSAAAPAAAPRTRPVPPGGGAHGPAQVLTAAIGPSAGRGPSGVHGPSGGPGPSGDHGAARGPFVALVAEVSPGDAEVAADANGEFTVSVTNTGVRTATAVRILLDDAVDGNTVGSSDGRCLGRIDAASPADLWCEVGAVPPGRTVAVDVHAYMRRCVGAGPGTDTGAGADTRRSADPAEAFDWRVSYADAGRPASLDGPAPTWSCGPADAGQAVTPGPDRTGLDTAEARRQP